MTEELKDKKKAKDPPKSGISRRKFLTTAGMGGVGVAAVGGLAGATVAEGAPPAETGEVTGLTETTLQINGRQYRLLVEPRWTLAFVLRERLGLTGTKTGCERGECGSCTVLIDGTPRYACMTLCLEAEGHEITTLEGIMKGEELGDTQKAFAEDDAFQCGYCTPGQIMSAEGLLRQNSNPSLDEIRKGMSGNLCRCGAYKNIYAAVKRAAEIKGGGGA
jgi:xanthine dehydrogenase YagT iron-sulfur-binding subunit